MRLHDVLIIGAGSIGERHLRCFASTGRADVRLAEIDAKLRREVAGRYGVSRSYGDLAEALDDPPGVAVVATPAPSHVSLATALAEAGVHVLIEKPLGTSLAGIDELRGAVSRRGVVAGVAYVYRAHPLLRAMRRAIAEGRFGRPVELVAVCGQHFPAYRPAFRSTYYRDHATGGGAIQDALTHVINAGEWLVGPVDRLVADAARLVLDGVSVEDTAHVLARHAEVLASYSLNQHQPPNEVTLTVICERGAARCEFHEHRWRWMTEPGNAWHDEPIAPLERDALFAAQAGLFLDAVEGGPPPLARSTRACKHCASTSPPSRASRRAPGGRSSADRGEARLMTHVDPEHEPTVQELFDLTGKVVLLTGGTGHLGPAMARALAEAGAAVVLTGRDDARAAAAASALPRRGEARHHGFALDHMQAGELEGAFARALTLAGRVDVLINNAHEAQPHDWTDVTAEQFTRQLANATAYFVLARLLREHAVGRGVPASIVLLGSMYGLVGSYPDAYEGIGPASPVAYHALKGGILQMTRHLAAYWARDGVRVNSLSPGPFPAARAPAELVERLATRLPLGHMGRPHELKGAIVFLASDASSFMTGQNLVVDGGWTAW